MRNISGSGIFVKHFGQYGKVAMKSYSHRDDYYIIVLLTNGSASVDIDFERIEISAGDILIVSPWQVHNKPEGAVWDADGWMLGISQELFTDDEAHAVEAYSVSPRPFRPDSGITGDLTALFSMLERHCEDTAVTAALATAIKNIVFATLTVSGNGLSGRYRSITLQLRKLLDEHIADEKSPAAYASMLNISEVYLNEAVKGATGLSAGAYIRSRVIVRAKRQLAYTSLPAKEIAYSLGYDDYAYFSKLFRKIVGSSPVEFRKNLK